MGYGLLNPIWSTAAGFRTAKSPHHSVRAERRSLEARAAGGLVEIRHAQNRLGLTVDAFLEAGSCSASAACVPEVANEEEEGKRELCSTQPLAKVHKVHGVGLGDDAVALELASRDVCQRVPRLDANTLRLAEWLEGHPAVKTVLHPKTCPNFNALMRRSTGHGCLLSFELKEGSSKAQAVYDALRVSKGPSLGTHFSLACPYTQLAHYDELHWAENCGVSSHLLRVSVGLEQPDDLRQRFQRALDGETD